METRWFCPSKDDQGHPVGMKIHHNMRLDLGEANRLFRRVILQMGNTVPSFFCGPVVGQCPCLVLWKVNHIDTVSPGQCPRTQVSCHHHKNSFWPRPWTYSGYWSPTIFPRSGTMGIPSVPRASEALRWSTFYYYWCYCSCLQRPARQGLIPGRHCGTAATLGITWTNGVQGWLCWNLAAEQFPASHPLYWGQKLLPAFIIIGRCNI